MAWQQAFGRETLPKLPAWPPRCAPAQSGSTASTSSTPLYPSEATSNPAGAERCAKTSSNSTRRRKQSARGCKRPAENNSRECPILTSRFVRRSGGAFSWQPPRSDRVKTLRPALYCIATILECMHNQRMHNRGRAALQGRVINPQDKPSGAVVDGDRRQPDGRLFHENLFVSERLRRQNPRRRPRRIDRRDKRNSD